MNGNIFLRTSVIAFVLSMGFGAYMGGTHDFTYAPVHGHLNLIGGVLMFLAGLFYNSHSNLSPKLVTTHYIIALLGLLLIIPGIYGSIAVAPWAAPVVGIGSVVTIVSALFFAFMVFKGTGKAKA
jgi:hypothetical protein